MYAICKNEKISENILADLVNILRDKTGLKDQLLSKLC